MGMLPCRSSSVCTFTAALCWRNCAQGNKRETESMVVESSAYRVWSRSTPDRIVGMKGSGDADQMLRKISEDAPVVSLVGIGQRGARHLAAEAHVVELAAQRTQARLDIAQTLAISELRESHRQILIPARQTPVMTVAMIAGHALLELVVGKWSIS